MIHIQEFLKNAVLDLIKIQTSEGALPPGHNGPYHDLETPVRNTAHFLFLLAREYKKNREIIYKQAAEKAIRFLLGSEARPYGKTFYCRDGEGKDRCNGLVGQAWVIEALVEACEAFGAPECYELAETIFLIHPFDKNIGIWQRIEIDGQNLDFDKTFNHQLWFAAAGAMLNRTPEALESAQTFVSKVAAEVQLYSDGVIFHSSGMGPMLNYFKAGITSILREAKCRLVKGKRRTSLYSKSVGYHGFNLYAFAMLYEKFPGLPFWESDIFIQILGAPERNNFDQKLAKSEFGYFYNLSGVEIAYAYEVFGLGPELVTKWLEAQYKYTCDISNNFFTKGSTDVETARSRIYELSRLKTNYQVKTNV